MLPYLVNHLGENGKIIALIKPQFEVIKEKIEKGGVVRDLAEHQKAIERVAEKAKENGLYLLNLAVSPITGTYGNIEYLSMLSLKNESKEYNIEDVMDDAKKLKEGSII